MARVAKLKHQKHRIIATLTAEILLGVLLSVGSFLFFYLFAYGVGINATSEFDTRVFSTIISVRSDLLTVIMRGVSYFGGEGILLLMIVISFILLVRRHYEDGVFFAFAVGMGYVINLLLKEIIQRPRPETGALYQEWFYSFPSGHAMNSFIFFSITVFFVYHFTHNKMFAFSAFLVSVIAVGVIGFSRVYLGVHYSSDVLAGFIAGFWWTCTALLIERTLRYFHVIQPHAHT